MCGLAGAFGDFDPQIVKTLLILNEERGRDSTGLYNGAQNWLKKAQASKAWLREPEPHKFIEDAHATGAIYCHTRAGTRGGALTENAHPFEYGSILGAHNGMLDAPAGYAVDSMYAMDLLSRAEPGAFQEALGKVVGWYVLVWRDARDGKTYFLNWNGDIAFATKGKAFYYSSCGQHLWTAVGVKPFGELKSGKTMVWDGKKLRTGGDFAGGERAWKNHGYSQTTYPPHTPKQYKQNRWDDSYTGDVMRMGKEGVWCGGCKNGAWRVLPIQTELHTKFPDAHLGIIFKLDASLLNKKEDKQLTDSEIEKRREEIIKDSAIGNWSAQQTEDALEKAGLA